MMNRIRFEGGRAIKTYTLFGNSITAWHSLAGDFVYSGRRERYERERDRLIAYNNAGLPVPEYLGCNQPKLEIVMERLNGRSFWKRLLDKEFVRREALNYLEKSAELLAMIHQHGEQGDSWLSNFIITPAGIYAVDFEQQNRRGRQGDLSSMYVSALVAIDAPKSEIRKAITYGYGTEPEEGDSPIMIAALDMPWLAKRVIR